MDSKSNSSKKVNKIYKPLIMTKEFKKENSKDIKKNVIQKNVIQKNTMQKNTMQKNTMQKNTMQKNTMQKNTMPKNTIEKNTISKGTSKNQENTGCPYSKKCGGCMYTSIPYEEQLKQKQNMICTKLSEVTKKSNIRPSAIVGAEHPLYYRNKVHSAFDRDAHGHIIRGIYQEDSHKVVNVSGCMIENKTADRVIEEIKKLLPSFKLKVYDEDTHYGFLRHVLVRVASYKNETKLMIVLVTSIVNFPSKNNFIKVLREKFPEIETIVQNINDKRTSMILGERNIVLYGKGFILDDSLGICFRISPSAFFQINSEQTYKLYSIASDFAGLTGKETVLDAYCGTGTIGMFLASKANQVIGVELNRDAVKDAIYNSKLNKIDNIFFVNDDATEYMTRLAGKKALNDEEVKDLNIDVLIMDPPRSGSTPEFIKSVNNLAIRRVVYVSCNPETLARDLKEFSGYGYIIKKITPVDMFPQTGHVETVCLLSRKP